MLPKLYSVAEVADYLDCGESTVYRLIAAKRLAAVQVGMKKVLRITEPALAEYLGVQP